MSLFIPKKIRIGFQERSDTFTGKLAYVIYFDEKGKIRQEASWQGWRKKDIPFVDYDNTPNSFILNKGVQRSGHWGSGRSIVRVYDSRDFEFEISIDNLIGILMHSDVSKRDIQEKCIFAWSGKNLVLLPVNSEEYQESVKYTAKQDLNLTTKDLVPGRTYVKKKSANDDRVFTYIGFYDFYELNNSYRRYPDPNDKNFNIQIHKGKKHIFHVKSGSSSEFQTFAMSTLAMLSDELNPEFSNLVEKFFSTIHADKIVDIIQDNSTSAGVNNTRDWMREFTIFKFENNTVKKIHAYVYSHGHGNIYDTNYSVRLIDGVLSYGAKEYTYGYRYGSSVEKDYERDYSRSSSYSSNIKFETIAEEYNKLKEQGYGDLYYVLANGNKHLIKE